MVDPDALKVTTVQALPAELVVQRGPFWMPIRGPNPTPIDTNTLLVNAAGASTGRSEAGRTGVAPIGVYPCSPGAPKRATPVPKESSGAPRGRCPMTAIIGSPHAPNGPGGRCRLLDSGESLSALWIARYPDSGKERKRVHHEGRKGLSACRRLNGLATACNLLSAAGLVQSRRLRMTQSSLASALMFAKPA
jgi:hypothetical protein